MREVMREGGHGKCAGSSLCHEAPNVQVRARQVRDAPQALLRCGVGLLAEAPQDKRLKTEVD